MGTCERRCASLLVSNSQAVRETVCGHTASRTGNNFTVLDSVRAIRGVETQDSETTRLQGGRGFVAGNIRTIGTFLLPSAHTHTRYDRDRRTPT